MCVFGGHESAAPSSTSLSLRDVMDVVIQQLDAILNSSPVDLGKSASVGAVRCSAGVAAGAGGVC